MNSLRDLVTQPEGRTLDRKREEVSLPKALKTLVAFANTAGGTLILGVADDSALLGVSNVKAEEERYASAIASGIEPPLTPDLKPVELDGVPLLLIRVPRFPGPFYLRDEGPDNGVYVRLGSTNRQANEHQREELRRLAAAQAYDERPCLGASLEDIDLGAVSRAFGRDLRMAELETLGVFVRHGDERLPSNGGIILFGAPEARARFFPNARVRCARFAATKADILDRLDIEGTVLEALDEAPRFIRRNTRLAARIEQVRREDIPEYASGALREVLANAVAHADYSQRGMPVRVQIFDDRLEVENPGGWPIGFSEEDFKEGISRVRNPVIARVLHELEVIEGWGSGYQRIRAASERQGHPMPDWREAGPVLRVRMAPHPWVTEHGVQRGAGASDRGQRNGDGSPAPGADLVNERQQWMLDALTQGARLSVADVAEHFGVNERTARRDVQVLRERGIIGLIGSFKSGYYSLRTPVKPGAE